MKKLLLIFLGCVMGLLTIMGVYGYTVLAEESLSATTNILVDTSYSNKDFVIDSTTNSSIVFHVSAGTFVLKDCNISSEGDGLIDTVFKVESGAKLILDGVVFSDIQYSKCISNLGTIEIKNTTFIESSTSIINDSAETNSITLYSGNLENVALNEGYLSVKESTVLDENNTINISLPTNRMVDGELIVKGVGDNVFASKYIDVFQYKYKNSTSLDDDYFLDYIGDFDPSTTTVYDASGLVSLQPGDIVFTTSTLAFTDRNLESEVYYSPLNCTGANFLKTCETLYRSSALSRTMNNYSANLNSAIFISKNTENYRITLDIVALDSADIDSIIYSKSVSFLTGSNHAIFVDIPSGYDYNGSVEFLINGEVTNILGLSANLYANEYYFRPIVEYLGDENYSSYNITVKFIFDKEKEYASVSLADNNDSIELVLPESMEVGNEYTFDITCASDEKIVGVTFNGDEVTLTQNTNGYSFNAIVLKNNVVDVVIKYIVKLTPSPTTTSFEYGNTILLEEDYFVEKTNESIHIEYECNANTNVGSYIIDSVKSCDKDNYILEIVGETTYFITEKVVDVNSFETKKFVTVYDENMEIGVEDFLVNILPSYITATIENVNQEYVCGEQTLYIKFALTSSNYLFKDNVNTLAVVLEIQPQEIIVTNCIFIGNKEMVYGNNINFVLSGYDTTIINVEYKFYLESDRNIEVVPSNVGQYIIKAILSSKTDLYNVSGTFEDSFEIVPKNIDLTEYISSINMTTYTYDGLEKYIDLKETSLPAEVIISMVDSSVKYVHAGIYYYNVNFETTSNNYSCQETTRVALKINPIVVTLSLATNNFNYTGKAPNLVINILGVLPSDESSVSAILGGTVVGDVGSHKVTVVGLSSTDYILEDEMELDYTISSISVDMSGVEFNNVNVIYDGDSHRPVLTGTLPLGISYVIDTNFPCINAGNYIVSCSFTSSDPGIIAPETMYASVTIARRVITPVYSEPSNMIANGVKKNIMVELLGVVDGEEVSYEMIYSEDPMLAGSYTCRVRLEDSETNYELINAQVYSFIIYRSSIVYNDNGLNMSVSGGKFASDEALTVNKITSQVSIVNLMANMNVKNYTAYDFTCLNHTNDLLVVDIDTRNLVEDIRYLRAYIVVDGKLEKIDYTISGNTISFRINGNEDIVFVEEYSYEYTHRTTIATIITLASFVIIYVVIIGIIFGKSKRKFLTIR